MSAVLAAAGPNNKVIDYWCTHQVVNWAAVGHEVDSSLRVTFDRRLWPVYHSERPPLCTGWPQKVVHFSTHHIIGTVQDKMKQLLRKCT